MYQVALVIQSIPFLFKGIQFYPAINASCYLRMRYTWIFLNYFNHIYFYSFYASVYATLHPFILGSFMIIRSKKGKLTGQYVCKNSITTIKKMSIRNVKNKIYTGFPSPKIKRRDIKRNWGGVCLCKLTLKGKALDR